MDKTKLINQAFTLPCGVSIPNRILKSALSENMGTSKGNFSPILEKLYTTWGQSHAGILFSGNVMIDKKARGEKYNAIVEDESDLEGLKKWAEVSQQHGTQLWMQINHPGRQAPKSFNKDIVAPSAVKLKVPMGFKTPRALTEEEILMLIERYANTARIAKKAGWAGVQIHGAHGYLVSQFLSPSTNQRKDRWGGSLENRARFVLMIYRAMRNTLGADFPISIKINSADFQRGGFSEEESMEVIDLLSAEGIDLIEVSGGTYEKAAMMGITKQSTLAREAYFSEFILKVRKRTSVPLMLTGGFRSIGAMHQALEQNELDFIGLGRAFCRNPLVAHQLLTGAIDASPVPQIKTGIGFFDKMGVLDTMWHSLQLKRMGNGLSPNLKLSPYKALFHGLKSFL